MENSTTGSPRFVARITGVVILVTIITGIFSQMFVSGRLVVFSDAAATARNILTHRTLFELGFAVYLVEMACNIAMTALFYVLFKPVSRSASLVAAFLGLAGCTIKTISRLFFIAPLLVLDGAVYQRVFNREQVEALALLMLEINDHGAALALAFFGFYTLVKSYLMLRAIFIPRFLGVLSLLGGVGWLTFLYPPLGYRAFSYVALVALVGSLALIGWLLVIGVDERRWFEQNAAGRI